MPRTHWSFLMPAEDHRQIKLLMTSFRSRFTQAGTIVVTSMFISADVASQGTYISAYIFFSFLFGCMITAVAFSHFFRPQVTAFRHQAPPPTAGDIWTYKITVKNTGKRPLRNLSVHEGLLPYGLYDNPGHRNYKNTIAWLEPGEKTDVQLTMECRKAGIYQLPPLLIGTHFPGGLVRKPVKIQQNMRIVVYPKYTPLSLTPKTGFKAYQPGGITSSSRVGESDEFFGTREFRQGDRVRNVHWASSARRGQMVVKEHLEEYFLRAGIIIDTRCSFWRKADGFERAVSLAAALAEACSRQDHIVDIMAMDETFKHFQAGRAIARKSHTLEFLAGISDKDEIDYAALAGACEPVIRQLTSLTVFLLDWDEARRQFAERVRSLGVPTKIYIIKEAAPMLPLPEDIVRLRPQEAISRLP